MVISSVLKTSLNRPVGPGTGDENGLINAGFILISEPEWTGRFFTKTGNEPVRPPDQLSIYLKQFLFLVLYIMFILMYLNWRKTFGYLVYNVFWLIYNLFLCIFLMFELIDVKFLFLYTYTCENIKYIFKLWKPVDPAVEPVEPKMISKPVQ